jgi:hypothetical protein
MYSKGEDVIGCAITSNLHGDGIMVPPNLLPLESKIKYWQIHTTTVTFSPLYSIRSLVSGSR